MDKKKVIKFVVITYVIAWALQIAGSLFMLNNPGNTGLMVFQGSLAVCMFAPLAAAWITNGTLKGMGWKPKFKGNLGWLVFAAYVSIPLSAVGGVLYYLIFPGMFDPSGSYVIAQNAQAGVDFEAEMAKTGMSMQMYMIITIVSLLYFPFVNMITAIGEEAGWRGFLYPELGKSFGKVKTWIIGGIIWAAFHFPAMLIGGYEYGKDYIGAPWLGLIVFTVVVIAFGVLENIVYDKTKCIWYPALLHGSINAALTMPPIFANADRADILDKYAVFGPVGTGLIVAAPIIVTAVIMGITEVRKSKAKEVPA